MPATRASPSIERLTRHAGALGCPELIRLQEAPTPRHLEYLDLLPARSDTPLLPDAVAEFQGRPVLYLIDGLDENGRRRLDARQIQDLQTLLANRSEHACVGVAKPGCLEVYPINLDRKTLADAGFKTIRIADPNAPTFFQSLATGAFEAPGGPKPADYVFETIHELLSAASEDLAGKRGQTGRMRGLDVLSTTGRALFFRFLIDRRIVLPAELGEVCPDADDLRDVFSNAEKAAATSCWLDETFNGDLLPLVDGLAIETGREERLRAYRRFYRTAGAATDKHLFGHLQAILRGWKHVGGAWFQPTFDVDWDDFNFAHIPIGVLSQVYETFSRQWDEEHAGETSIYYTPKNIARLMVEEAFAGVPDPAEAVVLDPACGGGVFLVLAFRHLVRKRWEKEGSRPTTRAIQRILYKQIRGFDVSESALRLSALALYISAIEVNPKPRPAKDLRFDKLQDGVLFNFGRHDIENNRGFVLGSLSGEIPASFNGQFDVVVTNPPWTRLRASSKSTTGKANEKKRAAELNAEFTEITRRVLANRGLEETAGIYTNPDNNPDLPFLWRATEWARPGGIIAMALPGRVILKQSGKGKAAREAIMRGLAVTGILNGSDLEETPVWPNMKLPFMLLFARNNVPDGNHHFHFATPIRENRLTSRGHFRIDYQAADTVAAEAVIKTPWLLKSLAVGTLLDVELVEKLYENVPTPLGVFWDSPQLHSGVGYKLAPNLEQRPAESLFDFPEFEPPPEGGFQIDYSSLEKWRVRRKRTTVHSPGRLELYQPPLLIIPQAPGEGRELPKSFLSREKSICFSQSYYGYSAAGHPQGRLLACALYLLTHSQIFRHFCLVHSSRIGASYRTFIKEDLEAFPFPDPNRMTAAQKSRIFQLAELLESGVSKPWTEIDDFIFELYGLDEHDATVVRDTVAVCGPYRTVRESAEQPPSPEELETFRQYLEEMLQPLFSVAGQRITVAGQPLTAGEWNPPWRFVSLTLAEDQLPDMSKLLPRLMNEANKSGASRIVLRVPKGGLLLGILNQRRFWTRSRARLCSLHIEQHHLDAFPMAAA